MLSRGELVFCGPRDGAVLYFKKQDLPVGKHINPADHFLELINYQFGQQGQPVEEPGKDSSTTEEEEDGEEERGDEGSEVPPHVRKLVDNFSNSKAAECNLKRIELVGEDSFKERTEHLCKQVRGKYATPFWYQTIVLMLRTFIVFIKNPSVYWARVLMYFLLALMMGTLFFQISNDQKVLLLTFLSCNILFVYFFLFILLEFLFLCFFRHYRIAYRFYSFR